MTTDSFRLYGTAPYDLVFIHGGPGARGSLAGVAQELGKTRGVLEALQTRYSIEELLSELHGQLQHAHAPVVLAGHSWGAWLGILYAARFARPGQSHASAANRRKVNPTNRFFRTLRI